MFTRLRLASPLLFAFLAGCEGTTAPVTDAAADVVTDLPRTDVANPTDVPAPTDVIDAPRTDVPHPPCPASRPFGACTSEGQTCDYRDPRPECGGINLSCRNGQWTENFHTDPGPGCFDAQSPTDATAPDASPSDVPPSDVPPSDVPRVDVVSRDASHGGNGCGLLGGVCVSNATACTNGGGVARAEGASGCRFSDGDGVCCVPPDPQPSGDACAARGGVCAPIAGCNFVEGSFAPQSGSGCTGVGVVCCLPPGRCGPEDQLCCGDTAAFRPACDRGTWRCTIDGTRLVPRAMCQF